MKNRTEVPAIVTKMDGARREDDKPGIIHVYKLEGGGIVFTTTPVEVEDDLEANIIIDAKEPEADTRPKQQKAPLYLLHILFLFIVFVGLDNVDAFLMLLAPTVTIAITPETRTVTTSVTFTVGGSGADIQGRILSPLTMSQSQTTPATGHGHQDARAATGTLTFYNGQLQSLTVASGTVFTGRDGEQIISTQDAIIPALDPTTTPPTVGQVTVSASAVHKGTGGNIQAFAISGSCCAASVIVKNLAPFNDGRNARDFRIVSKADIQGVVSLLTPAILQSVQAAFTAQLTTGESLVTPSCTPHTTTNHSPGDEAASVTVTVLETCNSIAYNTQALQQAGMRILATTNLTHFQRAGDFHVNVLSQTVNAQRATLTLQLVSTWVYQIDQRHITTLIKGKPRLDALHLLALLPGVGQVSITGIKNNEALPTDLTHIHLLIIMQE